MGLLLWVESTVGEQSPASTLFFSSLAVFSLLSFLDSSFFPIAGRYILLNVFLAIAVDNLSNPETLVEAQKLNDDQRPESKRESESEGEMRNDVDDGVDHVDHVDHVAHTCSLYMCPCGQMFQSGFLKREEGCKNKPSSVVRGCLQENYCTTTLG